MPILHHRTHETRVEFRGTFRSECIEIIRSAGSENTKESVCRDDADCFFEIHLDAQEKGELLTLPESFDRASGFNGFDEEEARIISGVVQALKSKSATSLTEMTHKENAWIETKPAKIIAYKHAKSLRFSLRA